MVRTAPPFSLVDSRLHHIYSYNLLISFSVHVSPQDSLYDVNTRFLLSSNRRIDPVNCINTGCKLAPVQRALHPTNLDAPHLPTRNDVSFHVNTERIWTCSNPCRCQRGQSRYCARRCVVGSTFQARHDGCRDTQKQGECSKISLNQV